MAAIRLAAMRSVLMRWWLILPLAGAMSLGGGLRPWPVAQAQDTITLRSDIQEANTNTGIITARGNVQIDYPAQQIRATSAQADYYSNERRIVLSGNVLVNQQGNTLRAEVVTYLIDEGRFVAAPRPNAQVETIYQVPANQPSVAPGAAPGAAPQGSPTPPAVLEVSPVEPRPDEDPARSPSPNNLPLNR
jgi:lipopolysaccharide export system protein LptA